MFSTFILGTWNSWWLGCISCLYCKKMTSIKDTQENILWPTRSPRIPTVEQRSSYPAPGRYKKLYTSMFTKMQKEKVTQTYSPKWWLASWWFTLVQSVKNHLKQIQLPKFRNTKPVQNHFCRMFLTKDGGGWTFSPLGFPCNSTQDSSSSFGQFQSTPIAMRVAPWGKFCEGFFLKNNIF